MRVLLDRLDRLAGRRLQRIGLSATVGNPETILSWLSGGRQSQVLVHVPAPVQEKHFSFILEEKEKRRMRALSRIIAGKKALVFVNRRSDAEGVTTALSGQVEKLLIHHSSLSPAMRTEAEEAVSGEGSACIICTSTLELGIDIGDLDLVVQVGPPHSVSSFLQKQPGTDVFTDPDPYSQTTPSDIGMLLEDIYQCAQNGGSALVAGFPGEITRQECEEMNNFLLNNRLPVLLTAGLPDATPIAHKHGWVTVNGVINTIGDAGIIYSPGGNNIVVVFLYHPEQLVWESASALITELSRAVYNYYNLPIQ